MSDQPPHTAAKPYCISLGAPLVGIPDEDCVFCVGTEEKRAFNHRLLYSYVSSG